MRTKLLPYGPLTIVFLSALAAGPLLFGQEETPTTRLLKSSEADRIAYLSSYIAEGMTTPAEDAYAVVLSNTSLFVPLVEQKIEDVLRSPSTRRTFSDPSADPNRVVAILAAMIEYTGEEIALKQASKLMKIDEVRFGPMVEHTLTQAYDREKGFQLAYRGLEIGDPAVDPRIMAWVGAGIGERVEPNHTITLRHWAEAVVEEYNGAPDEFQWAKDPIVSRLSADQLNPPGGIPLHDEMFRLVPEAAAKRLKK